jgi:hypothetical protein
MKSVISDFLSNESITSFFDGVKKGGEDPAIHYPKRLCEEQGGVDLGKGILMGNGRKKKLYERYPFLGDIFEKCRGQTSDPIINNTPYYNAFIIQPFGRQSYPDCLIFGNSYILPLEIKTTNTTTASPKFNDIPPVLNGLYLYLDFYRKAVMLFRGSDYSTIETFLVWERCKRDMDSVCEKYNKELENTPNRVDVRLISQFKKGTKFLRSPSFQEIQSKTLAYIEKYY